MIVGKEFHFDAAHYLPNYKGKCKEMHGHTWKVTVEVEAVEVNPDTGMVVDLHYLSDKVNEILNELDHKLLNDSIYNPTCENMVTHLQDKLSKVFPPKYLIRVKVQEGAGGYARC